MAGLATLSDMVPLVKENRVLAYYGLKVLKQSRRPGLLQLLKIMKIDPRYLSEDDIGYMIAPRINAASRMDDPMRAFELLAVTDPREAGALAEHLSKINDERKTLVATIMREANHTLAEREIKPVIVIGNPKWRVGVLGLVASRLTEEYKKPAFVWGLEGSEVIKGSCRSDGSVNLVTLMTHIPAGSFAEFGGHEGSAGRVKWIPTLLKTSLRGRFLNPGLNPGYLGIRGSGTHYFPQLTEIFRCGLAERTMPQPSL
jgi:single-stranded-DNA-specific exonuclease